MFVLSKIFCETDAQLTHQFISFHLAPVVGSYLVSQTESCKNIWSKSGGDNFDPEVAVRVRRGPLRSSCSGPAGTTAISRSQLRSGRGHFDPEVAVRVRRGPLRSSACSYQLRSGRDRSDLGLAAPVRRGRLRSQACSWGPAGTALILGLPFGSGTEHCDLELAVEVRRRRRKRRPADIKSNPYLTGGEILLIFSLA